MGEDDRWGAPPGSTLPGDAAPTEPAHAMAWWLADWWDPVWDVDWWGPVRDAVRSADAAEPAPATGEPGEAAAPAAGEARPGMRPGRPDAGPDMFPRGAVKPEVAERTGLVPVPKTSPGTAAEPSWGQVLATTVSLWVSRWSSGVSSHLRRRAGWQRTSRFRRLPGQLRHPPARGLRLAARGPTGRGPHARVLAALMLGAGLLAVAAGTAGLVVASRSPAPAARLAAGPSPVPVPSGRTVTPLWLATVQRTPLPVWLTVPAIGVRAAVVDLGLNPDGTLQVPASTTVAGWYAGSPRPGAIGSAVIAGHVDSRSGRGVFFWLRTMRPGERVYVGRADGTMAVFAVTSVRIYAKDKFPAVAVYGAVPDAELRLITCGGTFDESLGSYLSNVVVYARLAG
jgi:hypothetical protein